MKLLDTEKQQELLEFLNDIADVPMTSFQKNTLAFWLIELKPKRVRRNKIDKSNQQGVMNG